jgi:hypothetical protein
MLAGGGVGSGVGDGDGVGDGVGRGVREAVGRGVGLGDGVGSAPPPEQAAVIRARAMSGRSGRTGDMVSRRGGVVANPLYARGSS